MLFLKTGRPLGKRRFRFYTYPMPCPITLQKLGSEFEMKERMRKKERVVRGEDSLCVDPEHPAGRVTLGGRSRVARLRGGPAGDEVPADARRARD